LSVPTPPPAAITIGEQTHEYSLLPLLLLLLLFRMPQSATEKVRWPLPASLPNGEEELDDGGGKLPFSAFLPNGAAPETVLRR
jgi:hypothetical protein